MTTIFELGSTLNGRYRLEALLGAGGMGTVYRAFDTERGHEVALKFPVTEHDTKDRSAAIVREFATLKQFDHPGILKALDNGTTEDGKAFFSMEVVEGESLGAVITSCALPEITIRHGWLCEIARALLHIHEKGFLYCDLKPDNVIICKNSSAENSIKLLDFGITVPASEGLRASELEARGTTEYMSPEQHKGTKIDFRSDIYSFGVLAFEVLTGERPFKLDKAVDTEMAKVTKYLALHAKGKIPSPHALNPEVPKDLSTIVEVCMQKRRDDRFESMREVCECLATADGSSLLTHVLRGIATKFFGSSFAKGPNPQR